MMNTTYLLQLPHAEACIRGMGERLTQSRLAVLTALLACEHAATHQDITAVLATHHPTDRVTVYRVLDWLVNIGIAHRIAGDDRVWRFRVNAATSTPVPHQHAHFTCDSCGQTYCLEGVTPQRNFKLPPGFLISQVDLKLRGRCAACA